MPSVIGAVIGAVVIAVIIIVLTLTAFVLRKQRKVQLVFLLVFC